MSKNVVFCFTVVEKIDDRAVSQIISQAVTVAESIQNFNQFCVYLEEGKAHSDGAPDMKTIGLHEGRISMVKLQLVRRLLDNKRATEKKARQQPGHVSYRPPEILATNTCVVVVGTRAFCALVARAHMEEIPALRLKLIDILTALCGLKPYSKQARVSHEDVLITSVKPDAKDYITYNLNWVANEVLRNAERLSHESVMERLS